MIDVVEMNEASEKLRNMKCACGHPLTFHWVDSVETTGDTFDDTAYCTECDCEKVELRETAILLGNVRATWRGADDNFMPKLVEYINAETKKQTELEKKIKHHDNLKQRKDGRAR